MKQDNHIGILLMNLGGPPDLASVPEFMYALFSDRDIIQFPGGALFQKPLARLLTRLRTKKVQAQYTSIGGGSPILKWTTIQARMLEERLNGAGGSGVGGQGSGVVPTVSPSLRGSLSITPPPLRGSLSITPPPLRGRLGGGADQEPFHHSSPLEGEPIHHSSPLEGEAIHHSSPLEGEAGRGGEDVETTKFKVGIVMRYHHPTAREALEEMNSFGITRIVGLTLYPHYSTATTGSSIRDLDRTSQDLGSPFCTTYIDRYYDHPKYLAAMARCVSDGLAAIPEEFREKTVLLFSAHGLPLRFIERGDPYVEHIKSTVEGILAKLDRPYEHRLGFQSRVGPVRWIGPETSHIIQELAKAKKEAVLVIPVSFVSDHLETLYEVDQVYQKLAADSGIPHFHRCPSLNDSPLFADALADLVRKHLELPRDSRPTWDSC